MCAKFRDLIVYSDDSQLPTFQHVANKNIDYYITSCKNSYCVNRQAACTDFKKFFDECQRNGGPAIDWRAIKTDCRKYFQS